MNHAMKWTALLALTAGSLVGCTPPPAKTPPVPITRETVPHSRSAATALMVDHTDHFNALVAQMPGSTGAEHRKLLVGVLRELSSILQLANGAEQSPQFMNRIRVIDAAATTAGDQLIPRARMEAVENQAIHSTYAALGEIQTRFLYDDAQLPPMLDIIDQKAQVADGSIGPMHDLDGTEAFRAIQVMVQQITTDMVDRFGIIPVSDQSAAPVAPPAVAPVPATQTTPPPTTEAAPTPPTDAAPATLPATAPATLPTTTP